MKKEPFLAENRSMTLRELLWRRATGDYREEDAVNWALHELELGSSTRNLCMLAGLRPLYNAFEVETLLVAALREMGQAEPTREAIYRRELCETAREILAGTVTPESGCRRLAYGFRQNFGVDGFQPFYLLACALDEVSDGYCQWYDSRYPSISFDDLVRIEADGVEKLCDDK